MPTPSPRLCGSCGKVVPGGSACPCQVERQAKRRADFDRKRGSSNSRGYDAAWRAVRAAKLAMNPICEHPGCMRCSVDVHHEQSVRTHPHLRLVIGNLTALCHSHHSTITARTQGFAKRKD